MRDKSFTEDILTTRFVLLILISLVVVALSPLFDSDSAQLALICIFTTTVISAFELKRKYILPGVASALSACLLVSPGLNLYLSEKGAFLTVVAIALLKAKQPQPVIIYLIIAWMMLDNAISRYIKLMHSIPLRVMLMLVFLKLYGYILWLNREKRQ